MWNRVLAHTHLVYTTITTFSLKLGKRERKIREENMRKKQERNPGMRGNTSVFNFLAFGFWNYFSRTKMLKTNKQKLTVVIFQEYFWLHEIL